MTYFPARHRLPARIPIRPLHRLRRSPSARLAVLAIAAMVIAGCTGTGDVTRVGSSPYVVGSGTKGTEHRAVPEFHAVSASQGVRLFLATGPATAEVSTDSNLLDHVSVEVRDGVLYVGISGSIETALGVRVDVATPLAIDDIHASTGATVDAEDLACDDLAVGASTGATIRAGGRAQRIDLTVDTGSTADLRNVTTSTATVRLAIGSSAHVLVTDAATGDCSLSSTLYLHGSPATVDVATNSTSHVERD